MKKFLSAVLALICTTSAVFFSVFAEDIIYGTTEIIYSDDLDTAVPGTHNITFNNAAIKPNKPAGYNINGKNFYKLRDIAYILKDSSAKFSISYNPQTEAVYIETNKNYTPAGGELSGGVKSSGQIFGYKSEDAIYINNVQVSLNAYKIDGNNYFELRDLASKLAFNVDWDASTSTVLISTNSGWIYPLKDGYTSQPFKKKHLALDILPGKDVNIYAAADGVVAAIGSNGTTQDASTIDNPKGNGYFVVIEHVLGGKKVYSFYAHLQEGSTLVKPGDTVKAGQAIAICGNTGNSSARHLHFTIVDTLKTSGAYYGYTRDGVTISGNLHHDASGVTFYNGAYVIENQKLPEN